MLTRMHEVIARLRSTLTGVPRAARVEAEMADEFRHHIEMRTRDLEATGLSPAEAARRARVEFGHIDTHREQALASRGLGVLDSMRFSRLDVKLGLRMVTRYPGLSLVSVLGMTVAIAIGAGGFAAVDALMNSELPLHEGERIVAVQNSNLRNSEGRAEDRAVHDYVQWRETLTSVQDLSAFSTETRNVTLPDGSTDVINVARMSAFGFRVVRAAPILGRPIVEDDERAGAQPVIVIGYDEWRRRFAGDAGVIGTRLRLGSTLHTIVGVMPEDFRFPVNHEYWAPLHLEPNRYERGDGPEIRMFGRLAPGTTLEEAQAEIAALGSRAAAAYPETHGHLRAQVLPYTYPYMGLNRPVRVLMLQGVRLAIGLLLVVVAVNVAVLVYARTATRLGEIAVRTALGASRRRVVTQLFVEAIVLSGTAAVLGLGITAFVLGRLNAAIQGPSLPFWVQYRLSLPLILYVCALALVAAVIVGVLPALRVTGRRVQASLQMFTSRGSQIQLGRMWTAMIVLQVAVAVAALPYAIFVAAASLERGTSAERYPADEIVRAFVQFEQSGESTLATATPAERQARLAAGTRALLQRIQAEPDVAGATLTRYFPGYERSADIEVERGATLEGQYNEFAPDLLPLFDQPILAGRGFTTADGAGNTAVIVNEAFARAVGAHPDALPGRRVRLAAEPAAAGIDPLPGAWLDIVGVVPDFTVTEGIDADPDPLLYRPLSVEHAVEQDGVQIVIRTRGTVGQGMAGRLRELAAGVDPELQVTNTRAAAAMRSDARQALRFLGVAVSILTLSVLLLSSAGIYAMMSFTVARRRREIGIRSALGAGARQVLGGIFAKAGAQLGTGVLAGLVIAFALDRLAGGLISGQLPYLLPLVALIMMAVGLLAALGPARRGLSVQPTEALRGD